MIKILIMIIAISAMISLIPISFAQTAPPIQFFNWISYPSEMNVVQGSIFSGNVTNLSEYGGPGVQINESTNTPGIDIYLNWTTLPNIPLYNLKLNIYSDYFEPLVDVRDHIVQFDVYDFTNQSWMIFDQITLENSLVWHNMTITLSNSADFVSGGVLMARINHFQAGQSSHYFDINYAELQASSLPTPTGSGLLVAFVAVIAIAFLFLIFGLFFKRRRY